jgi:undecaprenyl-diphosphatase
MARQAPAAVRGSGGADGHLLRLIAAGTVPILVVGLLFEQTIEERLRTPAIAAVALALGSVALVAADRWGGRSRREPSLTIRQAVAIGAAQAAALVPGVSRSGATMVVALLFGLERDAAARFSFLLGVPAILGAALREGAVVATSPMDPGVLWLFLIGAVTSYLTGYLTVKYFIRYIAGHGLAVFAYYRLGLALTVPIWLGWS